MTVKKILFVAGEGVPFINTGGLGEVVGALPQSIMKEDTMDVRVIMPLYQALAEKHMENIEFVGYTYVSLAWRNQYCGIFKASVGSTIYYFIDNEYYFKRPTCYGHYDDGERFAFFCKAVLDILQFINFMPDIIHAHDWQTALIPIYLKTIFYQKYRDIRSVFTIHNIEYQGKYNMNILSDVFTLQYIEKDIVEYDGCINLMKGAIECADIVTTVSPTYAEEILSPFYSHGLTPIIQRNKHKIKGILNGIDTDFYNPDIDNALFKTYNKNNIINKYANKIKLQEMMNLPIDEDIPVIAIVSRLVSHKGMDIVSGAIDAILLQNVQLVVLGTGDMEYEIFFEHLQKKYPSKVAVKIEFNSDLSRKIYAGADIFLMPSKSEPCGLAQMIASRYGAVPVVRETGGLKDSIRDYGLDEGNGFTFDDYTAYNVVNAITRVLSLYNNKENWNKLVAKVMEVDFSWNASAKEYIAMYEKLSI